MTTRNRILFLAIVVSDQLSKFAAERVLDDGPIELIGQLRLTLVYNNGAAFGMFDSLTPLLTALGTAAAATGWVLSTRTMGWYGLGWVLIGAGASGNVLDRLMRHPGPGQGSVVDFLHIGSFPVFNLADMAVCAGALLLVLTAGERRARAN